MTMPDNGALLAVKDLQAWYGESHILHGVTFDVAAGEVVTLLGRNGVGKTTTLKAVMGIIESRTGSVRFEDKELISRSSDAIARSGIAFCPEERGIFSTLDVKENLLLPLQVRPGARLLLLDEPTEGLAPVIIQQIGRTIATLKAQGFTILLVEQNFHFAATVADRYYVMEHGRIVDHFAASELKANTEKLHEYLGV
jgi:branched-chain amino acid transport system ATP-binding protein